MDFLPSLRTRRATLAGLLSLLGLAACSLSPGPDPFDRRPVPEPTAQQLRPHLPAHWERGVFMEIFVRAYQDSDGDGIGDLRGLISRLDYLKSLGIQGIWLMPITANADGDHGYATTDFRAIAPEYGTLADFDELLKQAHARGIGVIMDYVINHASAEHPGFRLARSGPQAPFRDWFIWSDTRPHGWFIWDKHPWYHTGSALWNFKGPARELPEPPADARGFYFGTFGPHMPDFNFRHPEVRQYHFDSLRFWLNRGLDGFRLDATPHLIEHSAERWSDQPESRTLTHEITQLIHRYPNRYVVCEATSKPEEWGDEQVCGGAFAFGYVHHFVEATRGKADSVQRLARYFQAQSWRMATFVSNHDIFAGQRLWDQVGGDSKAYRLAAAGYLLQPGTPYIYYGEEIGQAGVPGLSGDLPLRSPMSWTADPATAGFTRGTPFRPTAPNVATHNVAAQQSDPSSLLNFYRALIGLRQQRASLARGSFEGAFADDLLLGFQRVLGAERTLVLIHYGPAARSHRLSGLPAGARVRVLHAEATPTQAVPAVVAADGSLPLSLAPQSVLVLDLVN